MRRNGSLKRLKKANHWRNGDNGVKFMFGIIAVMHYNSPIVIACFIL